MLWSLQGPPEPEHRVLGAAVRSGATKRLCWANRLSLGLGIPFRTYQSLLISFLEREAKTPSLLPGKQAGTLLWLCRGHQIPSVLVLCRDSDQEFLLKRYLWDLLLFSNDLLYVSSCEWNGMMQTLTGPQFVLTPSRQGEWCRQREVRGWGGTGSRLEFSLSEWPGEVRLDFWNTKQDRTLHSNVFFLFPHNLCL